MYLTRLDIKHLKLIKNLSLDFTREGSWRQWTVLLGRNGRGKTTLLQAIALAAVGKHRANALAGPFLGSLSDTRRGGKPAALSIGATFHLPPIPHHKVRRTFPGLPENTKEARLRAELELTPEGGDLIGNSFYLDRREVPDPLAAARGLELPFWFVVGYGVSRHIQLHAEQGRDLSRPSLQRLVSVFRHDPLIGLGFATVFGGGELTSQFNTFLSRVVRHYDGITPDLAQLVVHGRRGIQTQKQLLEKERAHYRVGSKTTRLPAAWLSHGYQSTLAWLGDLLGQYLSDVAELDMPTSFKPEQMTGLVLIDEIDLYLHPTWQRGFIDALSKAFPRLQFVVTTHSPALLTAFRPDEIVLLEQDEHTGDIVRRPYVDDPRLMTGSEVYEEFFDLPTLRDGSLVERLRRHHFLAADPYRSDEDEAEMSRLAEALSAEYADVALAEPVEREPLPTMEELEALS